MARKLFGTDGVRGVANAGSLTVEAIVRLARAGAAEIAGAGGRRPRAVIGRDTRLSGDLLESALIAGLVSAGVDVWNAGVLPTPAISFLTRKLRADFGVALTASHNSFEDNGIKFFRADGGKLADEIEARIEARLAAPVPDSESSLTATAIGRVLPLAHGTGDYIAHASATFPEHLSLRGLSIAVDCANGAAGLTTPPALKLRGAEVRAFHCDPDGENINRGCGSTHPEEISRLVRECGANIGIAHDGDADRLILCDENGGIVDGDAVLAITALDHLRRGALRENTLVATVMSNSGLEESLAAAGGKVLRTDVGDRYVLAALLEHDLNVGGEQSGHLIFRDFAPTGDGLVAAFQVLRVMVETQRPLSELARCLIKYPQAQRNVPVASKPPLDSIPEVASAIAEAEHALAGRGRVLVRYSGTEPKARVLIEGRDAAQIASLADAIATALSRSLAST